MGEESEEAEYGILVPPMQPTLDWRRYMDAQYRLDSKTFETKNLNYGNTSPERHLALMVELNEFANATKVFKYWKAGGSDRNHALEEFADVFHFVLAILQEFNLDPSTIEYPEPSPKDNRDLTLAFLSLMNSFKYPMDSLEFLAWIKDLFSLGSAYGFSLEDLDGAYWRKWEINLGRQSSGY